MKTDHLQIGVAGVAMLDLSWCGGLTEAHKIAAMADAIVQVSSA